MRSLLIVFRPRRLQKWTGPTSKLRETKADDMTTFENRDYNRVFESLRRKFLKYIIYILDAVWSAKDMIGLRDVNTSCLTKAANFLMSRSA